MPKSRWGNPFNSLQRYAFEFYMTSLLFIFFKGLFVYMYVSESFFSFFSFFLLVFQQVEPDDLLVARHVVGQVDQPYHRRRPHQAHRPDVQPVHQATVGFVADIGIEELELMHHLIM